MQGLLHWSAHATPELLQNVCSASMYRHRSSENVTPADLMSQESNFLHGIRIPYIMKEDVNLRSDLDLQGQETLADGSPIRARSCCMHRCHSSCFFDDRLALCYHVRKQRVT